jgi:hypothetical protein
LGRCLDRTRNKLPDSDNAWLKTGGNVTSGTPRASEARAAKNKKSAIDRLESRRTTFFTAHAREFTRQNTCASCSREQRTSGTNSFRACEGRYSIRTPGHGWRVYGICFEPRGGAVLRIRWLPVAGSISSRFEIWRGNERHLRRSFNQAAHSKPGAVARSPAMVARRPRPTRLADHPAARARARSFRRIGTTSASLRAEVLKCAHICMSLRRFSNRSVRL